MSHKAGPARGPAEHQADTTLTRHIRRRLLLGVAVSTLIGGVAIVAGLFAADQTERAYNHNLDQVSFIQDHTTRLSDALIEEVLDTRAYLITGDEQSVTSRELAHQSFENEYADAQSTAGSLSSEIALELGNLRAVHTDYDALADQLIALRRANQVEAAVKLYDQRSDPTVRQLLTVRQSLQIDVQETIAQANRDYSEQTSQIIILAGIVLLAGVAGSGWLILRLLAAPLQNLGYVENALLDTVQSEAVRPVRLPHAIIEGHGSMFQAYNSLVARLEDSEVLRLNFMSAIAHELRSRLASIHGYAALLEDPARPSASAALSEYARIIVKQTANMSRTIEDMLTTTIVEDDRLEILLAPLHVAPLLAQVVEEARQSSGRSIDFENKLGPALIMGDALRLQDVFSRLIDNAIKFSAQDTAVNVTLQLSSTPDQIEMIVSDRGIGIAAADLPLLFQRFGRIRNKLTQGIAGSGLGLYIAKYIVERHHGQILVHSQAGQGSQFVVTLPLAAETSPQPRIAP